MRRESCIQNSTEIAVSFFGECEEAKNGASGKNNSSCMIMSAVMSRSTRSHVSVFELSKYVIVKQWFLPACLRSILFFGYTKNILEEFLYTILLVETPSQKPRFQISVI